MSSSTNSSSKGSKIKTPVTVTIIGAITIISLAIILTLFPKPNPELCTKVDIFGMKFEQCPGELKLASAQNTTTITTGVSVGGGILIPGSVSEVNEIVEETTSDLIGNVSGGELNSIVGNWLVSGNTSDQKQYSASIAFDENNRFSSIINVDGLLSPPTFGSYNYSLEEKKLDLEPEGGTSVSYDTVVTSSDSFNATKGTEAVTFVRS